MVGYNNIYLTDINLIKKDTNNNTFQDNVNRSIGLNRSDTNNVVF